MKMAILVALSFAVSAGLQRPRAVATFDNYETGGADHDVQLRQRSTGFKSDESHHAWLLL